MTLDKLYLVFVITIANFRKYSKSIPTELSSIIIAIEIYFQIFKDELHYSMHILITGKQNAEQNQLINQKMNTNRKGTFGKSDY